MSDNIAVLHQGNVEQVGSPCAIYETPATAYVCDFIGESHPLTQELQTLAEADLGEQCFIRPERVKLVTDGLLGCDITLEAVVQDLVYKGLTTSCVLQVGFHSELSVIAPSYTLPSLVSGEKVQVGFNYSDIIRTGVAA